MPTQEDIARLVSQVQEGIVNNRTRLSDGTPVVSERQREQNETRVHFARQGYTVEFLANGWTLHPVDEWKTWDPTK